MIEPNYDAMLWAAADRHMSSGAHPEGEVTFTVERGRDELPEVLCLYLRPEDDCAEFQVECEVDDTDAVVVGVWESHNGKAVLRKVDSIVIPLTKWETQWTVEVAIQQAESRASMGDDRDDDRWDR
jgi:hypothetical protein